MSAVMMYECEADCCLDDPTVSPVFRSHALGTVFHVPFGFSGRITGTDHSVTVGNGAKGRTVDFAEPCGEFLVNLDEGHMGRGGDDPVVKLWVHHDDIAQWTPQRTPAAIPLCVEVRTLQSLSIDLYSLCQLGEQDFFTIYLHMSDGTAQAVIDVPTLNAARSYFKVAGDLQRLSVHLQTSTGALELGW